MVSLVQSTELKSFTTGEIAKFCGVTLRTVIRWIDGGKLKGYKLPGRGNNRVLKEDLLAFLEEYNMPVPEALKSKEDPLVLIVDDEPEMAKAIQRIAKLAGLRSIIANDGFQAGIMLADYHPVLMTLDLSMPGLDGFGVIKHTRNNPAFDRVNIVVISALPQNKLDEAVVLGANEALPKPFEQQQLLGLFESYIK
ncbi:MAG: response regulator [Salibacteraceae bacterium]